MFTVNGDGFFHQGQSECVESCAEVHWGVSGQGQGRHEEKTCVHACVHVPG